MVPSLPWFIVIAFVLLSMFQKDQAVAHSHDLTMLFVQVPVHICLKHARSLAGLPSLRPRTCLTPSLTQWLRPQIRCLWSLPRTALPGPTAFLKVNKTLPPASRRLVCKEHWYHTQNGSQSDKSNKSAVLYVCALGILMLGGAYAAVPLYQRFCQVRALISEGYGSWWAVPPLMLVKVSCCALSTLAGDRSRWTGGRRAWWLQSRDHEACQRESYSSAIHSWHSLKHAMELQAGADWSPGMERWRLGLRSLWKAGSILVNWKVNMSNCPHLYLPELQVVPGETALAFYKARNPTDKPIVGISTYNVIPYEAGAYFNKIQVGVKIL